MTVRPMARATDRHSGTNSSQHSLPLSHYICVYIYICCRSMNSAIRAVVNKQTNNGYSVGYELCAVCILLNHKPHSIHWLERDVHSNGRTTSICSILIAVDDIESSTAFILFFSSSFSRTYILINAILCMEYIHVFALYYSRSYNVEWNVY